VSADLSASFDELARHAEALSVFGYLTPRTLDAITAQGELLSAPLVVAAFRARGVPAELLDPRQLLVTDDRFGRAEPQADEIAEAARERVLPHLREGRVPVTGGFVGATREGVTTTLGRGGSDYSASLLGAALQADAIEIWTDVDGMLTADPRVVPGARLSSASGSTRRRSSRRSAPRCCTRARSRPRSGAASRCTSTTRGGPREPARSSPPTPRADR
jgi:aspartate kinase